MPALAASISRHLMAKRRLPKTSRGRHGAKRRADDLLRELREDAAKLRRMERDGEPLSEIMEQRGIVARSRDKYRRAKAVVDESVRDAKGKLF